MNYQNTEKYNYKFLLMFIIFYISTFPLVGLSLHKPVVLGPLHLQASSLIYPLTFFLADIITEVYGYKISRQLIWCQIPCTIYYQSILLLILFGVPTPVNWQYQYAYDYVFKGMGIIGFFGDFGLVIGFFLNSFLISKWKILLKGKYFWLRAIGASVLGESIQLSIGLIGTFFAKIWTPSEIIILFSNVIIFRLIMTIILSGPANIIATLLKKVERTDIYDYKTNFNPFIFYIKNE